MAFLCAYDGCIRAVPESTLLCEHHTNDLVATKEIRDRLSAELPDIEYIDDALNEYSWLAAQVRIMWQEIAPENLTRSQARRAIQKLRERFLEDLPELYRETLQSPNPYTDKITSIPISTHEDLE